MTDGGSWSEREGTCALERSGRTPVPASKTPGTVDSYRSPLVPEVQPLCASTAPVPSFFRRRFQERARGREGGERAKERCRQAQRVRDVDVVRRRNREKKRKPWYHGGVRESGGDKEEQDEQSKIKAR